jgi:hypothetical protein
MGRVNLGRWLKGSDGTATPCDDVDRLIATAVLRATDCDDQAAAAVRAGRFDVAHDRAYDAHLLRVSAAGAVDAYRRN